MALQGTIDSFAMADVLRLLAASAKTGRLIVNGNLGTASLWLAEGCLVGGSTPEQSGDDIADVVFDVLRFDSGNFIFEADAVCPEPAPPMEVEPALALAEEALLEWREIIQVVPSSASWISLAPELTHNEVVVDQACWASIVAVGGGTTVGAFGSSLGLGELASSRLVRALVTAGFVEVDAVDPPRETAAPADFGALPTVGLPDLPGIPELPDLPMRHPADLPPAFDQLTGAESHTSFEAPIEGDPLPSLTVAGLSDELFTQRPAPEPEADPADVNRSMSMLSSRAAQALASIAATGESGAEGSELDEDAERERMLRFLDSV